MDGSNKQSAVRTILTDDLFPFISQRIVIIKMDIGTFGEMRVGDVK